MEDTRHAIRQGRRLAGERLYAHALETWKAALSGAYSLQDHAGLFVLCCNVGEACVELAAQSKDGAKAAKLLQEGQESLDYALQVVEQCSLRSVMGGYRALYRGVRRAEALRRRTAELMDKLPRTEEKKEEKKKEMKCTTCGGVGRDLVLDENDGCFYCGACYEEYYASVEEAAGEQVGAVEKQKEVGEADTVEAEVAAVDCVAGVEAQMEEKLVCPEDVGGDEVEVVTASEGGESGLASEPSEALSPAIDGDQENKNQDRIRYERVELGSLADFLAGKLPAENDVEQVETQHPDHANDVAELLTPISAVTNPPDEEVPDQDPVAEDEDRTEESAQTNLPESDSVREEDPRSDEDAATSLAVAEVSTKLEYSIAELLELRKQSPTDCPAALLSSPVRDDGTGPRNKPANSNTRKKSSAKKFTRSAVAPKQSKTDAADQVHDDTPFISPLPTLDLCNTMRTVLQEHRNSTDPLYRDSYGILNTALFNSASTAAHVRLVAEEG
ncbi:hypothetical protein PR001_g8601 [Phytophthora rubi]|uniref:Uncharacterized protein n=1 Tax=Phytophthora rubi TaxID=129364 RepID=A0A6A3MS30_9STRA|nr:hypothetical protein PR002_g9261 [Phytophthora rubi]KAE9036941.1 hypothetical protein PR001_g8601 [Phytophthora rubi]